MKQIKSGDIFYTFQVNYDEGSLYPYSSADLPRVTGETLFECRVIRKVKVSAKVALEDVK